METNIVPGAVATVFSNKKLNVGDIPLPFLYSMDPPLSVQLPSPKGTCPICHPGGGLFNVWLNKVVTEHCETGLHSYWVTRACCQKLALAFCVFR
jgi:hypothetical protein